MKLNLKMNSGTLERDTDQKTKAYEGLRSPISPKHPSKRGWGAAPKFKKCFN